MFNKILDSAICIIPNNRGTIKGNEVKGRNSILTALSNTGTIENNIIQEFSGLDGTSNTGTISGNILSSNGQIVATNQSGTIINNIIKENSSLAANSNAGNFAGNTISGASSFLISTADSGSTFFYNDLNGECFVRASTCSGQISRCKFDTGIDATLNLDVTTNVVSCTFHGNGSSNPITLVSSNSESGKIFSYGQESTFECTIDITGLTDLDITVINHYCGVVKVTSSNPVENISTITNFPYTPIIIYPDSLLTITFVGTDLSTISANKIYLPQTTIDIDGTQRYWIQFQKDPLALGFTYVEYFKNCITFLKLLKKIFKLCFIVETNF